MDLKDIVSQFAINGVVKDVAPFGGGLINSTYKVTTEVMPPTTFCRMSTCRSFLTSIC